MIVPEPPAVSRIASISPTVHEAATRCLARASWSASGDACAVPPNPRALLGIAVHAVLARAARIGIASADEDGRVQEAAGIFDEEMTALFRDTHPLVRAKFGTPDRIPFHNLYRARAAFIASRSSRTSSRFPSRPSQPQARQRSRLAEETFATRDGKITGRPDLVDVESALVVDYKTGSVTDPTTPTESEARQLRLYAHLAAENGVAVRTGAIERPDGTRAEIAISGEEADEEGRRAREALDGINRLSGSPFEAAAQPSAGSCRHCPCIPFCPAFWNESDPSWSSECGTHVEGVVESLAGSSLVSMRIDVARGTGPRGPAVVSRLSEGWLKVDGAKLPQAGELVRAVDAGPANPASTPTEFRADRACTAVWKV